MSSEQLELYELSCFDVVVSSCETDEAYTTDTDRYPIIRLLTSFFGEIGLDPTANPEKSVPARHHFLKEDDCLCRTWKGLGPVFMNPPYSNCIPFLEKALHEHHLNHVSEIVFLLLSTTASNRKVGPLLRSGCNAFCLIHGRPPFRFGQNSRRGECGTLTVPSVLFYVGSRSHYFCEHFMRLGTTAYIYSHKPTV